MHKKKTQTKKIDIGYNSFNVYSLELNGEVSVPPESLNFTTETLIIIIFLLLVNKIREK